jgi:hypothetical protein
LRKSPTHYHGFEACPRCGTTSTWATLFTREDDGAVIAYRDRTVRATHVRLGHEVHRIADREILDRFNAGSATEALAADYQHVAGEGPPGDPGSRSPQQTALSSQSA